MGSGWSRHQLLCCSSNDFIDLKPEEYVPEFTSPGSIGIKFKPIPGLGSGAWFIKRLDKQRNMKMVKSRRSFATQDRARAKRNWGTTVG